MAWRLASEETGPMFQRFDDRARHVVVIAQEESRALNHSEIAAVHLLLALARDEGSIGNQVLASLGVTYDETRAATVDVLGLARDRAALGHIPFTPGAKRALELALRAAVDLGDRDVGTDHVLLGLLDSDDADVEQVLAILALDAAALRSTVLALRPEPSGEERRESVPPVEAMREFAASASPRCSFCGRELATVAHYFQGAGGAICGSCAANAVEAIEQARIASGERRIDRLPSVHGVEPYPGAIDEIATTVRQVVESDAVGAVEWIESGHELADRLAAIKARHEHLHASVFVQEVRFDGPDRAEVRFTILLPVAGPVVEGTVVRRDGRWLASRALVGYLLHLGGER
jgi:hypothetical protein